MGGIIGGSGAAPTYTVAASADTTDADAEARKQREEAIARNRRGRAGMVATSDTGVLTQTAATGKTLLGE